LEKKVAKSKAKETATHLARPISKDGHYSGKDAKIPDSFFGAWTGQVRRRFAREIEALRRDMDERAFLATDHGAPYGETFKNAGGAH
jgi:hypothetical protein